MICKNILGVLFVLFVAFSIGLNLGMHGVINTQGVKSVEDHALSRKVFYEERAINVNTVTMLPSTTQPTLVSGLVASSLSSSTSFSSSYSSTSSFSPPAPVYSTFAPSSTIIASDPSQSNTVDRALAEVINGQAVLDALKDVRTEKPPSTPISDFISTGGVIPIVLLTCNRPQLLIQTLDSLFKVRGVTKSSIVVAQDGTMKEVSDVVKRRGLKLVQNTDGIRLRGGMPVDGGVRIAMHYKYALTNAFNIHPDAPALIVIEDDLLFSPDMYEYFANVSPILERDSSTFLVSAWNDNGFRGKVKNQHTLLRTEFFPGLGWLLPRTLYKQELEANWPMEHWDHWLRSEKQHRNREIIYPQVPRTFHNGIQGTFMNLETHNRYFRNIAYNTDETVLWPPTSASSSSLSLSSLSSTVAAAEKTLLPYELVYQNVYEARIRDLVSKCHNVRSLIDLIDHAGEILCVWINVNIEPNDYRPPDFDPIAKFFGIWHEHKRGAHRQIHEFYWGFSYILLINLWVKPSSVQIPSQFAKSYKDLLPMDAQVLSPTKFDKRAVLDSLRKKGVDKRKIQLKAATTAGLSCDEVCEKDEKMECKQEFLELVNTCNAMNENFKCGTCKEGGGEDQPAYVSPTAAPEYKPNTCFISPSFETFSCSARHAATLRLCVCGSR